MQHSFDIDIATEYGVTEAILLNYLYFWISKNVANGDNYNDGYYWTYNSVSAFCELFPYLSKKKIANALNKLEENELIITGNYNKKTYDRTKWYALTQKGWELFDTIIPKGEMDYPERGNGLSRKGKPIPIINTVNNTIIKKEKEIKEKRFVKPTLDEVAEYCRERNNNINPESFIDFYESKGWKVGNQPMKDWKACVRTWERRNNVKPQKTNNSFTEFPQRTIDNEELERKLLQRR